MIALIDRRRFKKTLAWIKDVGNSKTTININSCFQTVIITHKKRKSCSTIVYTDKIYASKSDFDEEFIKRNILKALTYLRAEDFIQFNLLRDVDTTSPSGFLDLTKHMDNLENLVTHNELGLIDSVASSVVIPVDFLKYPTNLRKCFYAKMMGKLDWGRAYFVSKHVFLDMFKLLPTYLSHKCGLVVKRATRTENSYNDLKSMFDYVGHLNMKGVKELNLTERCLLRIICDHLEIKDLSSMLKESTSIHTVSRIQQKEKKNASNARKR